MRHDGCIASSGQRIRRMAPPNVSHVDRRGLSLENRKTVSHGHRTHWRLKGEVLGQATFPFRELCGKADWQTKRAGNQGLPRDSADP